MIFAPSRRQVTVTQAERIAVELPPFVAKVGVFVDESRERILEAVEAAGLDLIQLHGGETPEFAASMPLPVLKAIRVRDAGSLSGLAGYRVAAFLLDAYDPEVAGGTGRAFDWSLAVDAARRHRVVLSGGLRPDNVVTALEQVHPYAVDVSSGVETGGSKDHGKIRDFVRRVREWEHRQHAVGGRPRAMDHG
jgi:phosphoribosylanthranilate isomerase